MKVKLFIGLAFAAIATGGCFLAGNSAPRHQFTPDEIANIEALTAGESSGHCKWKYAGKNNYGIDEYHCVTNGTGYSCTCGSVGH